MGYSYCARTGRLACDSCGAAEGNTRKRTCPYRVQYAEGGSLPYCYPSALCKACYAKHKATLHADCEAGAAKRTAEEATKRARLAAGELEVRSAWGSWHPNVPVGFTGVYFENRLTNARAYFLVPADAYAAGWLADYPGAIPWAGPDDGATSKQVTIAGNRED